jgi:hypothetical protein
MKKLLLALLGLLWLPILQAQTISIIGSGVNGWPPTNGPEITLNTTDNIVYTKTNLVITTGEVKFRQDFGWTINWGAASFPTGIATQNGNNIPTLAGTYDVTFNRLSGAYTFTGSTTATIIDLWGPAVDAQLGYGGPGVALSTGDEINYSLNYNFTTGNAYFRQNGNNNLTYGSTAFPSGTAVASGPSIPIQGGEWFVSFNRLTGAYTFDYPSIGILGSALNGWDTDTDMTTSNGFVYSVVVNLTVGSVKFRKNNNWTVNWGGSSFPNGIGSPGGNDIAIPTAGTYEVFFEPSTGNYSFNQQLGTPQITSPKVSVWPNPSADQWNFTSTANLDLIRIQDISGKTVIEIQPSQNTTEIQIEGSALAKGIYFAQVYQGERIQTHKLVKN